MVFVGVLLGVAIKVCFYVYFFFILADERLLMMVVDWGSYLECAEI